MHTAANSTEVIIMQRLSRLNYRDEFIFDPFFVAQDARYWWCPNTFCNKSLIILEEWAVEKMTIKDIANKHEFPMTKVRKLLREGAEEYKWAMESLTRNGVDVNIPHEYDVYHLMVSEKLRKKEGNRLIKYKCRDLRRLGEFTKEEFLGKFKGWRLSFKAIYKIMDELDIQFKS